MKCPKCGYLGFETGDRCRNCGYDFSLAGLVPSASTSDDELMIKLEQEAPGLPMDLSLVDEEEPHALGSRAKPLQALDLDRLIGLPEPAPRTPPKPAEPLAEATLFSDDLGPGEELPLAMPRVAARPPPLSVRRATPEVPRLRPRQTPRTLHSTYEAPALAGLGLPSTSPEADDALGEAPPVKRTAAALVDLAGLGAIDVAVVYLTLRLCGLEFAAITALPWIPLAGFLLLLNGGYFITFAAVGGQTIGQMALGLRVVGADGTSLAFGRATLRTLAWLVSTLPLGLGLWFALGGDHRTLHDRVTATRVVYARP